MISKLKNFIKNSKGPFTKEGAYLDYTEIHVFENGLLYGFRGVTSKDAWERIKKREDGADEEYTYFHWGYVMGNRIKFVGLGSILGAGGRLIGLY